MEEIQKKDSNEPQIKGFYLPNQARNFFLNPRNFTQDKDLIDNQKILSQIYETIYNLYEAKKSENYIPTEKEIYEDLEFRKKAISDKTPLPPKEIIYRYYFMLAAHEPAFIAILRELRFDFQNKFHFITKIAIPFRDNLDFLQKSIMQVLHNSMVAIRNHIHDYNPINELKERIQLYKSIDELEEILEYGQINYMLKKIYFYKNQIYNPTDKDLSRINIVNQKIKEHILKPLLYQLTKENHVVTIKRKLQISTDILLVNNIEIIQSHFHLLLDLVMNEITKKVIFEQLSSEQIKKLENFNRVEQANFISNFILSQPQNFPKGIQLLATDILGIHEYIHKHQEKEKLEQDKEELKQLIQRLTKASGILRVKNRDKSMVSDRVLDYILKGGMPSILFATIPIYDFQHPEAKHYNEIYFLWNDKKSIGRAIEQAQELFRKIKDVHFIRILEQMFRYHDRSEQELSNIIPSYLREDLDKLISDSYLDKLPIWLKIFYKIINGKISRHTLKEFWKDYYQKNKLKFDEGVVEEKETTKTQTQRKTKESKDTKENINFSMELYKNVIKRIEGYLERDFLPTEKIILKDFENQKRELQNLFQSISMGAKSFQDIIFIETKQDVYLLSRNYLKQNKERLIQKYNQKLQEAEGIKTKTGQVIALKLEKEKVELYKKILQILNQL
ncbi:MAG: hypothetical protein NZ853_03565 [Leptospiraceae bacterium]|nr:hypothetical protein [Leptospiraceae bacterium]MDW7975252.1 hypothetical protein [Leptospiraceae bacterium]